MNIKVAGRVCYSDETELSLEVMDRRRGGGGTNPLLSCWGFSIEGGVAGDGNGETVMMVWPVF